MRFVSELTDPPSNLDFQALREAVDRSEIELAVLFGSFASNDQSSLSDLDIAVHFQPTVSSDRKFEVLDSVTVVITEATGIEAVDLLDLDTVGPAIGYTALSTGTLVYGDHSTALDLETAFLLRKLDFQQVKQTWDQGLTARLTDNTYGRP